MSDSTNYPFGGARNNPGILPEDVHKLYIRKYSTPLVTYDPLGLGDTNADFTELAFTNVEDLPTEKTAAQLDANWYTVVNGFKSKLSALADWILGRINNLATTITAFRTGDVIPVDGPSGTAKMSKDTLLELTAQNALAGNLAPAFDPNRTSENQYKSGEIVVYDGKLYRCKTAHSGVWDATNFSLVNVEDLLSSINDELGQNVVAFEYAKTRQDKIPVVFGVVDNTGTFSDSTSRKRTDYIDINSIVSIDMLQDGTLSSRNSWIRCFDKDKVFCGNYNVGSPFTAFPISRDSLKSGCPSDTQFIIMVSAYNDGETFDYDKFTIASGIKEATNLEERVNGKIADVDGFAYKIMINSVDKNLLNYTQEALPTVMGTVDVTDGSLDDSTFRRRTDFIDIDEFKDFFFSVTTTSKFWVRVYDSNKGWLGTPVEYNNVQEAEVDVIRRNFPTAKYVIIVINTATDVPLAGNKYTGIKANSVQKGFMSRISGVMNLTIPIDDTHTTSGRLMLPSNYDPVGKPVPLIVFCPGSSDYTTIGSNITSHYMTQYQYLVDEGFALLSVFGWGDVYGTTTGAGTWNTPTNRACWYGGIEYVLNHFNVSRKNIFVACKSMGGAQALAIWADGIFPIRAAGLLAPAMTTAGNKFGYSNIRKTVCADMDFSEDTEGVLDYDTGHLAEYIAYATENYSKWIGYEPWLKGLLGLGKTEKIAAIMAGSPDPFYDDTTLERFGPTGSKIKIWVAEDDGLNKWAVSLVNSLQNTGCTAEYRLMPAGCNDPHHAVDTDPLAEQKTNITTRNGVHYDSIALAYYEMAQMFISKSIME